MDTAAILAHQGGWDETLMVAVPVLVLVGLVGLARRRAKTMAPVTEPGTDEHS